MLTYITRRVLYSIPVLAVSSFLSFFFVSQAGDPLANLRQNPRVSQLTLHKLVHVYHLDASVPVRYWYWLTSGSRRFLSRPLSVQRSIACSLIGPSRARTFSMPPRSMS